MTDQLPVPSEGNFLFYQSEDATTRVRVILDAGTVWLTQKLIAGLYDTSVANINIHLRNIFKENELQYEAVIKEYLITASDGKSYRTMCYNLEAILAIGYRVRSLRGTQFRRWATRTLREFLVKGFVLDDERLKAAETTFGRRSVASIRRSRTSTPRVLTTTRPPRLPTTSSPPCGTSWSGRLPA